MKVEALPEKYAPADVLVPTVVEEHERGLPWLLFGGQEPDVEAVREEGTS